MPQKGFTLIELLIVIAIVAILTAIVILVLNPAELSRQARDSIRISDLANINNVLNLYLADGGTFNQGGGVTCYAHASSGVIAASGCSGLTAGSMNFSSGSLTTMVTTTLRLMDGTGWVPVNFTKLSSGLPFGILPIDPLNNSSYFYAFAAGSSSTWKINARMESAKYKWKGVADVVTNDGEPTNAPNNTTTYAIGNKMDL